MKLAKPFLGVPDGEIYPVQYEPGDTCPPELEAAATALGAAESDEPEDLSPAPTDAPAAPPVPPVRAARAKK